ncbi:Ninjurin 1 [Mactra antiquata]
MNINTCDCNAFFISGLRSLEYIFKYRYTSIPEVLLFRIRHFVGRCFNLMRDSVSKIDELSGQIMAPNDNIQEKCDLPEKERDSFIDVESGEKGFDEIDGPGYPIQGTLKATPELSGQNVYVGKRNFIHQMMDVALLMANVSQLKALLNSNDNNYFDLLFVVIVLSLTLQVIFAIVMITIFAFEKSIEDNDIKDDNDTDPEKDEPRLSKLEIRKRKTAVSVLDRCGNILVLGIIVSNVFITGFGVGQHTVGPVSASQQLPKYYVVQNRTLLSS